MPPNLNYMVVCRQDDTRCEGRSSIHSITGNSAIRNMHGNGDLERKRYPGQLDDSHPEAEKGNLLSYFLAR